MLSLCFPPQVQLEEEQEEELITVDAVGCFQEEEEVEVVDDDDDDDEDEERSEVCSASGSQLWNPFPLSDPDDCSLTDC